MPTVALLIVNEDPAFRARLRGQLSTEQDIYVAGEAGNGHEAITMARTLAPNVILADVNLPDTDGIELTRTLRELNPHIAVVLMTPLGDDSVSAAIQAGATSYVRKEASKDEMVRAIRSASGAA